MAPASTITPRRPGSDGQRWPRRPGLDSQLWPCDRDQTAQLGRGDRLWTASFGRGDRDQTASLAAVTGIGRPVFGRGAGIGRPVLAAAPVTVTAPERSGAVGMRPGQSACPPGGDAIAGNRRRHLTDGGQRRRGSGSVLNRSINSNNYSIIDRCCRYEYGALRDLGVEVASATTVCWVAGGVRVHHDHGLTGV
jgi:hypothetical protein